MKKKLLFFTGAGMSAESGISTYRDTDGIWQRYKVEEVASAEGLAKNPELVFDFCNQMLNKVREAQPNKGHVLIAELEKYYDVDVVTQNVDDLHERGGSSKVLHIHGKIFEKVSAGDPSFTLPVDEQGFNLEEKCPKGFQLRPNVVFFGEDVPDYPLAVLKASEADLVIVVGTSLQVYPAANLIWAVQIGVPIIVVNPDNLGYIVTHSNIYDDIIHLKVNATEGLQKIVGSIQHNIINLNKLK